MKKVVALLFVTVSLSLFATEQKTGENVGLVSCDKVSQSARQAGKSVKTQTKSTASSDSSAAKGY